MLRRLDGLNLSSDVESADGVLEVGDGRVSAVVGAEDVDGLELLVGRVDVLN